MVDQVVRNELPSASMLVKVPGRCRTGDSGDADAGSSRDEEEATCSTHRRRPPRGLMDRPGPSTSGGVLVQWLSLGREASLTVILR